MEIASEGHRKSPRIFKILVDILGSRYNKNISRNNDNESNLILLSKNPAFIMVAKHGSQGRH